MLLWLNRRKDPLAPDPKSTKKLSQTSSILIPAVLDCRAHMYHESCPEMLIYKRLFKKKSNRPDFAFYKQPATLKSCSPKPLWMIFTVVSNTMLLFLLHLSNIAYIFVTYWTSSEEVVPLTAILPSWSPFSRCCPLPALGHWRHYKMRSGFNKDDLRWAQMGRAGF